MVIWVVVSNNFYFHPYLGKIPILTDIFQMGWNHHLVIVRMFVAKWCPRWWVKKHLFENLGNLGKLYDIHLDVCIFFRWVGEKPRTCISLSGTRCLRCLFFAGFFQLNLAINSVLGEAHVSFSDSFWQFHPRFFGGLAILDGALATSALQLVLWGILFWAQEGEGAKVNFTSYWKNSKDWLSVFVSVT